MNQKYSSKPSKVRVARFATPDQVISVTPITDRYLGMSTAKEVLDCRHSELKSWRVLGYELAEPHATLSAIVKRDRKPTTKLIRKMNNTYGCHLHLKTVRIEAPVCPVCDQPYEPRHKCAVAPKSTRKPDPVVRWNRVERPLMNALAALYDRDIAKTICSMCGVITCNTEYYQVGA